jgi:hypothetical protein
LRHAAVLATAFLLVLASCAGPEQKVRGVVADVTGDLIRVERFTVVDSEGDRFEFVPAEGLIAFEHGAPLSHLVEHRRTGQIVEVVYSVADDGTLVAERVDDR